jgi:signal transduction histidine kinase
MQIKTDDGHYKNVASQAVGGTALGLAIPGTLAFLNQFGGNLGGIFGGNNNQCQDTRMISALESEIAMLKSERYTDNVGTQVYAEINKKYIELAQFIAELDKKNAVFEAINAERINCLSGRVSAIEALTKLVIPNGSVCPGWGNVTVTPATTTTA